MGRLAFVAALAALIGAVLGIRALAGSPAPEGSGGDQRSEQASASRQPRATGSEFGMEGRRERVPVRAGGASSETAAQEGKPEIPPAKRRAARAVGEAFLAAYGRYEVGRVGEAMRGLGATATPEFLTELQEAPPRLLPTLHRVRWARLRTLEVLPGPALGTLQIAGLRTRGGRPEPYSFALSEEHGRLLVAGPAP